MSHEETLGLIQGLAHVIKEQNASNKSRADELATLAAAVKDLSEYVGLSSSSRSSALRLPNLTLPEFMGAEDLDSFLEQFTQVLHSSRADCKHYLTYLKQQCRKDVRAFDFLCSWEAENFKNLPAAPTKVNYEAYFNKAVLALQAARGIPKDQQIRTLLATYYMMHQQPGESVSNFAHRFCETQHSLEKLIPGIHQNT